MKIMVLTSLYPNNIRSHHGVFVKERISRLAKLPGIELKVVAPVPYFPNIKISNRWEYSQVSRREIIEGIDVRHPRYFLIPKIGMPAYGCLMALSLLPRVRKLQQEFDFDIFDAHYVYPDGFAAVMLGRILKKPVVITARGTDINLFARFHTIRPLLHHCLCRADSIITVSQALKDSIAALDVPSEKIRVIPNGVDIAKFHRIPSIEARSALGLPLDKKVILSVGGLVELKGFDILIRALDILRNLHHRQDICLAIVGDGKIRSQLERLAGSLDLASSVRFAGDVPHHKLFQWYSAANLFCLASKREGMPNVILESFACGTPVVATDVGGIPEIVDSNQLGLLCERNDRSFAIAIQEALSRDWDHEHIVRYASDRTWDQVAQSIFGVLKNTVTVWEEKENH